jgi:peptidoglycan/xylan/chitin deacetylase (PgdA/CDA1 family)
MGLVEKIVNSLFVQIGKADYLLGRSTVNPVILFYHGVSANLTVPNDKHVSYKTFKDQLISLKRYFKFIRVEDIPEILSEGGVGEPCVSVTFDDGYKNNYDVAAEILNDLGVPATFFISTEYIGKNRWMWTDLLEYSIYNTEKDVLLLDKHNMKFDLGNPDEKYEAIKKIKIIFKEEDFNQIDILVRSISSRLLEGDAVDPFGDYEFMSWDNVKGLYNSGFSIGAHTVNHPILSNIDISQAKREIIDSRQMIIDELGQCSNIFCYPNGKSKDYTDDVVDICKQNYSAALTTNSGCATGDKLYELNRIGISDELRGKLLIRRIVNYALDK